MKPFVPDYVPAVGDVDEFVKVPRPDGRPDELGIRVLDEPAARQSDATVLSLRLRHANKQAGGAATSAEVRSVDKPEGAPRSSTTGSKTSRVCTRGIGARSRA